MWREVVGFEGYYKVSDQGRLKTCQRRFVNTLGQITILSARLLSTFLIMGREALFLKKSDGNRSARIVHILVADAFVPKPPPAKGKMLVRHKDGNTNNNRATNLEWYYFYPDPKNLRRTGAPTIAVVQCDRETGADIKRWESVSAAAAGLGINRSHIGEECRSKSPTSGGFKWRFEVKPSDQPKSSEILSRKVDEDEELS